MRIIDSEADLVADLVTKAEGEASSFGFRELAGPKMFQSQKVSSINHCVADRYI